MAHDILQRFLSARLFDVRGDDALVNKLRETAGDLADIIRAAPHRAAAFTMVAIDAEAPADEPILVETLAALEKRWNSYSGAFSDDRLIVVGRAIVLEALSRLLASDPIALAVALTARNLLPHLGATADRDLWLDLLADADRRLEGRARREWALPSAAELQSTPFQAPAITKLAPVTVKRDWLQGKFESASGPHNRDGQAGNDPNPHWPNSAPEWSYDFAPRATRAVADALDAVAKRIAETINDQDAAGKLAAAVTAQVSDAARAVGQTAIGLERRSSLLWWHQALYSPGAGSSYRDMDPIAAAGWMAVDAVDQAGAFAPRMTEAFLMETMRTVSGDTISGSHGLADIARAVGGAISSELLRTRFSAASEQAGRTSLTSLLGGEAAGETYAARLGLPADFALSPAQLTLWIYRDLQVALATGTPGRARRKVKTT